MHLSVKIFLKQKNEPLKYHKCISLISTQFTDPDELQRQPESILVVIFKKFFNEKIIKTLTPLK